MSIRERLTRRAYAPGLSFSSADDVDKYITDAGYKDLLDNTKYERLGWSGDENNGAQSSYGYQRVGIGVNNPKKYGAEAHRFLDKQTGEYVTVIIVYQLLDNEEGVTKRDPNVQPDVQVFRSTDAMNGVRKIDDKDYQLKDGTTVRFGSSSLEDANADAKRYINNRNQNLQGGVDDA